MGDVRITGSTTKGIRQAGVSSKSFSIIAIDSQIKQHHLEVKIDSIIAEDKEWKRYSHLAEHDPLIQYK